VKLVKGPHNLEDLLQKIKEEDRVSLKNLKVLGHAYPNYFTVIWESKGEW
jgi:hypothetical protein